MICVRCLTDKEDSCFYRQSSSKTGLQKYCKVCCSEKALEWRTKNPERHKENRKKHYSENTDKELLQMALWRSKNKGYTKTWRNLNKVKSRASYAKRRAKRNMATPPWLSEVQLKQIEYFYFLARDASLLTGEPYEVDHIEPLVSNEVCGLHVPWNLQVLPRDLNRKKSNNRPL